MSGLSSQEFVAELIADVEDRLEGHFTDAERWQLENAIGSALRRLDTEETQPESARVLLGDPTKPPPLKSPAGDQTKGSEADRG